MVSPRRGLLTGLRTSQPGRLTLVISIHRTTLGTGKRPVIWIFHEILVESESRKSHASFEQILINICRYAFKESTPFIVISVTVMMLISDYGSMFIASELPKASIHLQLIANSNWYNPISVEKQISRYQLKSLFLSVPCSKTPIRLVGKYVRACLKILRRSLEAIVNQQPLILAFRFL